MASAVAAPVVNGGSVGGAKAESPAVADAKFSQPVSHGRKVWGRGDYTDADPSRWVVIFPHYLDSTRKRSEGRRIAREHAVENPHAGEIFDCVRELGFRTQLELDKSYCRDCWVPGRIRIELFDSSGNVLKPDIASNRQALFLKVASALPAQRAKAQKQNAGKSGGGTGGGGGKGAASSATAKKKKKGKR